MAQLNIYSYSISTTTTQDTMNDEFNDGEKVLGKGP